MVCGKLSPAVEVGRQAPRDARRRRGGTWPSLVKAPDWGSGEQEFKSPRPDKYSNTGQNVSGRRYGTGMAANSSRDRKWSDTDLTEAVAVSRNLLVSMPDGIKRVQVKTTTYNNKRGWMIQLGRRPYSIGNNAPLVPYDPALIDLFFIVDGD